MQQSLPECWYLSIKLMPTSGKFKLVVWESRLKSGKTEAGGLRSECMYSESMKNTSPKCTGYWNSWEVIPVLYR